MTANPDRLRIVGLCAGLGGIEHAFAEIGDPVAFADTLPAAEQALKHRWPEVPHLGDWTTATSLDPFHPDLITAGLPCQPFSDLGDRQGDQDTRSLFNPFLTLLEASTESRPMIFLENVDAFATNPAFAATRRQLTDRLTSLNYDLNTCQLAASQIGAPHRRNRFFAFAAPTEGHPKRHLFARLNAPPPRDPTRRLFPTPVTSIENTHFDKLTLTQMVAKPIARFRAKNAGLKDEHHPTLPVDLPDRSNFARPIYHEFATPLADPKTGQVSNWRSLTPAVELWTDIIGRPPPTRCATDRLRLTPSFLEWLMGLPDHYIDRTLPLTTIFRLIGNSVVPQQVAAATHHLTRAEDHALRF